MGFRLSNVIGAPFRDFVVNQLATRVAMSSKDQRNIEQVLYLGNKIAWVKLNSSVEVNEEYAEYLNKIYTNLEGFTAATVNSADKNTSIAKNWILSGGTSKQIDNKTELRSGIGLDGAYGLGGIYDQGYRPMPGLESVTVETAGKLGSLRYATINFKVWNMNQLDVIDALYFRLGFTMLLEWGHTVYYDNKTPDPTLYTNSSGVDNFFEPRVTKEELQYDINLRIKETDGNYDAMLGTVTNFTYSMNQEGGWDCSIKLIGLGSIMDTQKINGINKLPPGIAGQFKKFNAALAQAAADIRNLTKKQDDQAKFDAEADPIKSANQTNAASNKKQFPIKSFSDLLDQAYLKHAFTFPTDIEFIMKQLIIGPPKPPTDRDSTGIAVNFTLQPTDPFGYIVGQNIYYPKAQPNFTTLLPIVVGDIYNIDLLAINKAAKVSEFRPDGVTGLSIMDLLSTATVANGLNDERTFDTAKKPFSFIADASFNSKQDIDIYFPLGNVSVKTGGFQTGLAISMPPEGGPDKAAIDLAISAGYKSFDLDVVETQLKEKLEQLIYNSADNKWGITEITPIQFSGTAELKNASGVTTDNIAPPNYTNWLQFDRQFLIKDVPLYKNYSDSDAGPVYGETYSKNLDLYITVAIRTQNINYLSKLVQSVKPPLPIQALPNRGDARFNTSTGPTDADKKQTNKDAGLASALEAMLTIVQYSAITQNPKAKQITEISVEKVTGELLNYLTAAPMAGLFTASGSLIPKANIKRLPAGDPNNYKDPFYLGLKGYNTSLMSGQIDKETANTMDHYDQIPDVRFDELLKGYLLPKQIIDSNEQGGLTQFQQPVYIRLGYLLFFINNICLLYDSTKPAVNSGVSRPHFYIDFNPDTNFCLTTAAQFSVDPQVCLIPAVTDEAAYKSLFVVPPTKPFNFAANNEGDIVSAKIQAFRSTDGEGKYRGHTMNILVNTQHLLNLIRDTADRDNHNDVYLRPFLDRLMADINKSLGDINAFRVGYIDASNTVVILDDQFVPPPKDEENLLRRSIVDSSGKAIIPIFGKGSIARSLEFQTNITSKMSSLIAIGARSTNSGSAQSTDASSLYHLNKGLTDRIISQTEDVAKISSVTKTNTNRSKNDTTLADKFNTYVASVYGKSNSIDKGSVDMARNYYIQGMNNTKAQDVGASGAPIIPLNLSFSTDGISGMNMGNVFLIPEDKMPISLRGLDGKPRFGYMVVGLNHQIQNNQWITNVRGQIIRLRPDDSYKQSGAISAAKGSIIASSTSAGGVPPAGSPPLATAADLKDLMTVPFIAYLTHQQGDAGIKTILYYTFKDPQTTPPKPNQFTSDDIQGNMESNIGPDFATAVGPGLPHTPENFLKYQAYKFSTLYQSAQAKTEYDSIFQPLSTLYGVPLDLIKTACEIESRFIKTAVTPSGTFKGLFQLNTAGFLQYNPGASAGDIFDPALNANAGVQVLKAALQSAQSKIDKYVL